MPFHGFERVMACSRADLDRWLRELTGSDQGVAATGRATLAFDWGELRLETEPMPPRRIALLKVQQLRVRFVPPPGRDAEARDWIERFDHHTQRGGG
jgi:hypothetical protein